LARGVRHVASQGVVELWLRRRGEEVSMMGTVEARREGGIPELMDELFM